MSRFLFVYLFIGFTAHQAFSQGFNRHTYHDAHKKYLKEVYQVIDTIHNVLHGRYTSYYLNGSVESKGQFANNETTGVWEFFFETGNLKMRGLLRKNSNYGIWEYFYESGQRSMQGMINGKNREGEWKSFYENGQVKEVGQYLNNKRVSWWKMYFEDGVLKGEINYEDDFGMFKEYYHSGKLLGEGTKLGSRNFGHWRLFAEDSTLQSEGDYTNGKKNGDWINYHPNGKIASKGNYDNDKVDGKWEYFFDDGKLSSSADYLSGKRNGSWRVYNIDGSLKSETSFVRGSGECKEYFKNGKLKAVGRYENDLREGTWKFFYEDGRLEGECTYVEGKGIYSGYFPDGNLQTKGELEDEVKIGTWEIYEHSGKLSGYYKPFYENRKLASEIAELAGAGKRRMKLTANKRFTYFDARPGEFRGIIVEGNPILTFVGSFPIDLEFYQQERLGHEFELIGLRDPFYITNDKVAHGKLFTRGYSMCVKQKFYNPLKIGMWYFGHELRFTNKGHYVNEQSLLSPGVEFTASAVEQRIEWGPILGYRILRKNNSTGFTIDTFASYNLGYRNFNVASMDKPYFTAINQSSFSNTFHIGLNIGYVFAFK